MIAIQNGGGLRASIDGGPITMGEVLTVLPFQNTLATFQLTGAQIVEALENGVSQVEDGAGRFPQVAGMRYVWNAGAEPGSRIVSVEVEGADGSFSAIDPEATYGVVSNNFMRSGGDGYAVFAAYGQNAYDFGPGLEEVVADYIGANAPTRPTPTGGFRGRIRLRENSNKNQAGARLRAGLFRCPDAALQKTQTGFRKAAIVGCVSATISRS
jgi:5'-nucleotidase/UDP-sugar diphosphatase